jgi:hypothetical protein
MQDENSTGVLMSNVGASSGHSAGLLAKVRNRTERELGSSPCVGGSPYSAAALGQAPYVAMGNGVIIVQRRCNPWSC